MNTRPSVEPAAHIRPAKLAHVVFRVRDLQRSRAWYTDVLQARVTYENDTVCFLSYDDEHHRVGLLGFPGLQEGSGLHAGMDHVAFTYGSLADLIATYTRLAGQGIKPYWTINHGPTISMYYKDPDANRLELQYDVFETQDQVDAFLGGDAYRENFIGVKFDPEDLAARFDAGESLELLTVRPPLARGQQPWDMVVE